LKTEAGLTVVSEDISAEIARWSAQGKLSVLQRSFKADDLNGMSLVYAATENDARNGEIADLAAARQIPANAADYKEACRFITSKSIKGRP